MTIVLMRKHMLGQGSVTYDEPPDLDQVWIEKEEQCLTQRQSVEAICSALIINCQSTLPWPHPSSPFPVSSWSDYL